MLIRPTSEFCARAKLPKAYEAYLDPEQFTFDGLRETLDRMVQSNVRFCFIDTLKTLADANERIANKMVTLFIPVHFSPSNAEKIAAIIHQVGTSHGVRIPATFIFDDVSPLYDRQTMEAAMANVKAKGFTAGHTDLSPHDVLASEDHLPANIVGITTSKGFYSSKHPNIDFINSNNRSFAIFEIADYAYSNQVLLPYQRICALPEVAANMNVIKAKYFNPLVRDEEQLLGMTGTVLKVA